MQKAKLWEYRGTVRSTEFTGANGGASMTIILHDESNRLKAPVKVEAFGELARYLKELLLTDCVEKYMPAQFGYDENLVLTRITYKNNMGQLVKIVAQEEAPKDGLIFFGQKKFINTPTPSPLSAQELQRFCRWNIAA